MSHLTDSNIAQQPSSTPVTGVAKAAGIISLGNIVSRILGLAREFVKADLFGATGLVSAFEVANIVPTMIYDLLIGGMISSALVPVMSEHASHEERRQEFWYLASILLSLAAVFLSVITLLGEFLAPQIAWLFGARNFTDPALYSATTRLLRIMLPAVLFLNLSGLVTGVLYSLKRFTLPAFTAAIFNATVVVFALIRSHNIDGLAWGVLAGSIAQLLLQLPSFQIGEIRWVLDLKHPALRRIVRLYLPIVLGVVVSQIAIGFSYNLATQTGDESVATMRYATTIIQFPLGLVATAISIAILPTLSQQAFLPGGDSPFRATLAQGLNLVLVLIIPATVGLFVLAQPIVGLAFEHGDFLPSATEKTARVLMLYLIGLPFAAVDQVLIFAFYARKNTLAPALVGVLSVVVYLVVAILLIRPLGLYSLMIADSIKHMVHAGVMTFLLHRELGSLRDGIGSTSLKSILAAIVMGAMVQLFASAIASPDSLIGRLIIVAGGGTLGLFCYAFLVGRLKVPAAQLIREMVLQRKARGQASPMD